LKSDAIAKLDGTYKLPGSAVAAVEMTETQHSIFNAPALVLSTAPSASAQHGLPPKPTQPEVPTPAAANAPSPDTRGQKRPRDEEEEEESDEDVEMEEDSDDE